MPFNSVNASCISFSYNKSLEPNVDTKIAYRNSMNKLYQSIYFSINLEYWGSLVAEWLKTWALDLESWVRVPLVAEAVFF